MGCDLILRAAAAGSNRLMAIKLELILKMQSMNKTKRFQRARWGWGMGRGHVEVSHGRSPPSDSITNLNKFYRVNIVIGASSYMHASSSLISPSSHWLCSLASGRYCLKFAFIPFSAFSLASFRCNLKPIRKLSFSSNSKKTSDLFDVLFHCSAELNKATECTG